MARVTLSNDEMRVIGLALWTYLDSVGSDDLHAYNDDDVTMERLLERLRKLRGVSPRASW